MVYYMNDEINKPLFRVKHVSCTLNNIFSIGHEKASATGLLEYEELLTNKREGAGTPQAESASSFSTHFFCFSSS